MYQQALGQTGLTLLPVLAMLLFAAVFVAVIVRVWRKGEDHPDHVYSARLPLHDDTTPPEPGGVTDG